MRKRDVRPTTRHRFHLLHRHRRAEPGTPPGTLHADPTAPRPLVRVMS